MLTAVEVINLGLIHLERQIYQVEMIAKFVWRPAASDGVLIETILRPRNLRLVIRLRLLPDSDHVNKWLNKRLKLQKALYLNWRAF